MYMIIVHGHNTIHWARTYCELANVLVDANKWSEVLSGETFPYSLVDLEHEFHHNGGVDKITYCLRAATGDRGYMISIMREGDAV